MGPDRNHTGRKNKKAASPATEGGGKRDEIKNSVQPKPLEGFTGTKKRKRFLRLKTGEGGELNKGGGKGHKGGQREKKAVLLTCPIQSWVPWEPTKNPGHHFTRESLTWE